MSARLSQLRWGGAQAGITLTLASSGWLLSGLTPSPLINSLLPALTTLPALLPLRRRLAGYTLELFSALLLVLLYGAAMAGNPTDKPISIAIILVAALIMALGQDLSQLPLQRRLISPTGLRFSQLRHGSELGALLGSLLTGLLKPGLHQFLPAFVLLLPLLPTAYVRGEPNQSDGAIPPLDVRAAIQGALFGSFFALLPLWVRSIAAGNCFNFGMVLAAYGIGRSLSQRLPKLPAALPYWLIAALLLISHWLPGWVATALFIPLGALAAASDSVQVQRMSSDDPAAGWQILLRSGAIGGLIGILVMGSFAQMTGLSFALPLQLLFFLLAPVLIRQTRSQPEG